MYCAFHRVGLLSHVKEKKLHLSNKNIKSYLEFARKYDYWTVDDWNCMVFLDKTKINKFSSNQRIWC